MATEAIHVPQLGVLALAHLAEATVAEEGEVAVVAEPLARSA